MLEKIKKVFSIDARALAVFRIALSLIIIFDLIRRSVSLVAHYTDRGILPRADFISKFANPLWVSLHVLNGSFIFSAILFIIAGIFALMLLVGYRTKIASVFSWFLLISLHSRNPLILQGGDILLRVLLFWAIFLPLGERYSVDEVTRNNKSEKSKKNIFSFWTLGILLQVASVWVFSALLKTGNEWFPDGSAIYYAFSIDQFATYLGKFLLGFPNLLFFLTYVVFFFELIGPFLLFIPFFFGMTRTIVTFGFFLMIFGMGSTLYLAHFPFVSATAMIIFLPSWFWDKLFRFFNKKEKKLKVYYDSGCGRCRLLVALIRIFLLLPKKVFVPSQDKKEIFDLMQKYNSWVVIDADGKRYFYFDAFKPIFTISPLFWIFSPLINLSWIRWIGNKAYKVVARRRKRKEVCFTSTRKTTKKKRKFMIIFLNALAVFFIIYVFLWNVQTLGKNSVPDNIEFVAYVLRIDQMWNMFAPYPLKDDGWYVIEGRLKNGEYVDLLHSLDYVDWKKPKSVDKFYPTERWRKYLMNLWNKDNSVHRGLYLRYLCKKWNTENLEIDEKLEEIKMYFMLELTLPDYQEQNVEKVFLLGWNCF